MGHVIREWLFSFAMALIIVVLMQHFLFSIIRVDGHSMDGTLADGERLFYTAYDVRFGEVRRGSIVICH